MKPARTDPASDDAVDAPSDVDGQGSFSSGDLQQSDSDADPGETQQVNFRPHAGPTSLSVSQEASCLIKPPALIDLHRCGLSRAESKPQLTSAICTQLLMLFDSFLLHSTDHPLQKGTI